jgi:hypothetical protein
MNEDSLKPELGLRHFPEANVEAIFAKFLFYRK